MALITGGGWWATRPATWPKELDPPVSEELFKDPMKLTEADKRVLSERVTRIAREDPLVVALLDGSPWPEPEIGGSLFYAEGRSTLIGGAFTLALDNVSYSGPWPSAGCSGGRYRGRVESITATGLTEVHLSVDLTFERVTNATIPPIAFGEPGDGEGRATYEFGDDLPDEPYYTGRCPIWTGIN